MVLALLPGTSADKVIKLFEDQFGKVRNQSIPCDGGIHTEDLSAELSGDQTFGYCVKARGRSNTFQGKCFGYRMLSELESFSCHRYQLFGTLVISAQNLWGYRDCNFSFMNST